MPAPAFTLPDQDKVFHGLSDYPGKWLVLYFYPKDGTFGCTKEACDFRDSVEPLRERGAEVVGISADSVESHRKFIARYGLPFTLLSDPEGRVAERYDAKGKMFGKVLAIRQTFLIDPDGIVRHIWRTVPIRGHSQDIRAVLEDLQREG